MKTLLPWIAAAAFTAAFAFLAASPAPRLAAPPSERLPDELPGYNAKAPLFCQNENCLRMFVPESAQNAAGPCPACGGALGAVSLPERVSLPADTAIEKRVYRSTSGTEFLVSLVVGGKSKQSIHRPELCMPAQGLSIEWRGEVAAQGRDFRVLGLRSRAAREFGMAYTFFNQDGFRTDSHHVRAAKDIWDRSVRNTVDRWAMLVVFVRDAGGERTFAPGSHAMAEMEHFLKELDGGLCK